MRCFVWILLIAVFASAGRAGTADSPAAVNSSFRTNSAAYEDMPVALPPPNAMTVRHYQTGNVLWCARTIWEIVLPALLVFSGFSARLRDWARRLGHKWYFALCIFFIALALLDYALNWPLNYYIGFVRSHAYGLSNQTFAKWCGDSFKELAVMLAAGAALLWIPYLLLNKSPRRWWLYAGLAMVPFYFLVQTVKPVVFDPLFNHFTPIENKVLESKILSLAERAGIHGSRVYEVKKSVETKTVNAYVTGFGDTKRIVLWDTALDKLDEHELLFVVGHEMGHYALHHVVKGILCLAALTLVAFWGTHVGGNWMLRRWGGRFGFHELSDMASLPLFILLMTLISLVLTPIGFAYSRHLEHEADRFGLELTHYNHSAATGFTRLMDDNLDMPHPGIFYMLWRGTHPSIGERIDFFNRYKPWDEGKRGKYEAYFSPDVNPREAHKN